MSGFVHHINWNRLASAFSYRFSSRYGFGKGKSSSSDSSPNKGRQARYADLEDRGHGPGMQGYETPLMLMRTYVRTGKTGEIEEDGIHLQYDVEQMTSPKQSDIHVHKGQ